MTTPQITDISELLTWSTHDREPFFKIALDYIKPDSSVLDIGCGAGDFARLVTAPDLHLVDGNPETVEKLNPDFANVHLHQIPERLPFPDSRFDVVHCSHLVEHLVPDDFYKLISEVDRVMQPGGHFVVSAPLPWHGFYNDLSHVRPYPPAVFSKYMCSLDGNNFTRRSTQGKYTVVKLQYRYAKKPPCYFDVSTSHKLAKKTLLHITNFLRRIAFSKYETSGFTLVLQKKADCEQIRPAGDNQ